MKSQIFKSASRGKANYGWLKANYLFSFAQYYNPERMHFGALRVFNDDYINAGKGFDTHPHDNMEIITIPLVGSVLHKDSMGHESLIKPNDVQVMSAGTGIFHSEFNGSETEELNLFQLWIIPSKRNVEPTYNQLTFDSAMAQNKWQKLVAPVGNDGLTIHQNAWIHQTYLDKGVTIDYSFQTESLGSLLMVVEGSIEINGTHLGERDSIAISECDAFTITAIEKSRILNIEVPNI